jgi:hypothetical protein
MTWQDQLRNLRALPEEIRQRRMWDHIPQSVAESMAFEQEAVSLELLQAQHSRRKRPVTSKPREASSVTSS